MHVNVDLTHKHKSPHQQDVSSILTLEPLCSLLYSKLLLTSVWWKFVSVIYYKNYHCTNKILEHDSVERFPELAFLSFFTASYLFLPHLTLSLKRITDPNEDELRVERY